MNPGIYKNNKTRVEYLFYGVGEYVKEADGEQLGTVFDSTNSCDGTIRDIYQKDGKYFILVSTDDEFLGKKCAIYHRNDEMIVSTYFVREVEEFNQKFTFSRLY